jgi:peptidoglycan hydrolase CwlO-like protein
MDYIQILEMLGTAFAASWLTRVLTIKARVRQEKAGADKAETEVKADQIENIEKLVEKVYKPTIETLTNQVNELRRKVDSLERENGQLRAALKDLQAEAEPAAKTDGRGQNGKSQPRQANGRFVRKEDSHED